MKLDVKNIIYITPTILKYRLLYHYVGLKAISNSMVF